MTDLLFILADYPFREANRQVLSDLLGNIEDWEKLVRLVNDHGIIALARYNIKEAGLDNLVPKEALSRLENGYRQSIVRNSWLTERWKGINDILCKAGIKHILLKGMALEHTIYGSKGLRQMSDCDILIKRNEALSAWKILQDEGFVADPLKSPLYKKIILDIGKHLPTLNKDGFAVEIHTRLFSNNSIDDELFKNAVEIIVNNNCAYILPDAIHLNYLIDHFNYHLESGECQLRLYTDIRLLDPLNPLAFPANFIESPFHKMSFAYRRRQYRSIVSAVPPEKRLRFITGDVFPSVRWMMQRHDCGRWRALLYYPRRFAKLIWLL